MGDGNAHGKTEEHLSEGFEKGMDAYHHGDYTKAINVFEELLKNEKNGKEVISTAEFYIAESLMGLNKINYTWEFKYDDNDNPVEFNSYDNKGILQLKKTTI